MSQKDPYLPPQGGQYIPPPPPYGATSDIPPQSPYHYSAAPRQANRSALGWLGSAALGVWAVIKYGAFLLFKIPALTTLLTGVVAVGAYALLFPWQVAVGLVVLIFVHEMGHVIEVRRQGLAATAPIFIPFLGAAIFMRTHAQTPIKQAEIAIAGPIAGTLGAVVAFVLYGYTHNELFLVLAYLGFFINLLNLIPFGMLDGGWILAPVSKWVQVGGLVALGALFFTHFVSPFVVIVLILGLPMVLRRFRDPAYDRYLTSGTLAERASISALWLVLVAFLGFAFIQTQGMHQSFVR